MPGANTGLPPLQFGLLSPADTPLLVRLVQDCYGDSYAHAYFYDAETLRQLIADGMLHCAVAMDPDGRVVAHMAVKLEYPGDRTADNYAGMMLPEYRGQGVLMQLGTILFPVYESLQLCGLQTATVTHHAFSQKISNNTGTVTVGCLLADSPGSNADGLQFAHRMPILMQFYPFHPLPARTIHFHAAYLPLLQHLYAALQCPVTFADGAAPAAEASRVETASDARRGTALLRFHRIGDDGAAQLEQFLSLAGRMHARYVDVPLRDAAAAALIEAANVRGWFFGGLLIGRAGTDFLRLQRCELPPADSRAGIVDPGGRELVAFILQDRERIAKSGSE